MGDLRVLGSPSDAEPPWDEVRVWPGPWGGGSGRGIPLRRGSQTWSKQP
jgi:hypothetical protein